MFNFWWSAKRSKQRTSTEMEKNKKGPLSHWKTKCSFFGLCSTSDDRPSDPSKKHWPKCIENKKGPLSHQKIKCSFLDHVQLLMISQAIWENNIDRNTKRGLLNHQKIKCLFLDYVQLLMISRVIWAKNIDQTIKKEKGPLNHQKIKCSFLDYVQLLMIGQAIQAKNIDQTIKKKKGPLSPQKIKCSFLDYVQLLMIGQAIWAKNVNQSIKKRKRPPKSSKNKMFIFGSRSTSDGRPSDPSKKHRPKWTENNKGPLSHQKIKCSFLDYVQLLMISQAVQAKTSIKP